MKETPTLLLIDRTVGAEFDSRVQKILGSLKKHAIHGQAILWERNNRARHGCFPNKTPFAVKRLVLASKKRPRPGPVLSACEIIQEALQAYWELRKRDVKIAVVQNHRQFLLIGLLALIRPPQIRRIVWDLRELPTGFMGRGSFPARLFARLLRTCDSVIVTNESRLSYMRDLYGEGALKHTHVIPNYVTELFAHAGVNPIPENLAEWLRGRKYYYSQNPSRQVRYPYETVCAVLDSTDKALVVTGRLCEHARDLLRKRYGEEFDDRVYQTGMLPEVKLLPILDAAFASIIFYDSSQPNKDRCDANRLYQAIARGIPVLAGNNKGMKSIVEELQNGVVVDGDGRDLEKVFHGIRRLEDKYDTIRQGALLHKGKCLWEENEQILINAVMGEQSS